MDELKFSKKKQVSAKEPLSTAEKDKRFKSLMRLLWACYNSGVDIHVVGNKDLHHVNGKKSGNRYDMTNVIFLTREEHDAVHNGKLVKETPAFWEWVKTFNFSE